MVSRRRRERWGTEKVVACTLGGADEEEDGGCRCRESLLEVSEGVTGLSWS